MNNSNLKECKKCGSVQFVLDGTCAYTVNDGVLYQDGVFEQNNEVIFCLECNTEYNMSDFKHEGDL